MAKIEFSGVFIRSFSGNRDKTGPYLELQFTANYTAPVCKDMGWNSEPYGEKQGVLIGALVGTKLIFTPNKKLSKDEMQLDITTVDHFTFHVLKSADGESTRTELRFNVKSIETGAAGLVEEFYKVCSDEAKGKLVIAYSEQKQMDLPEGAAEEQEELPVG